MIMSGSTLFREADAYTEKAKFLDTYFEKTSPEGFYRDLFPVGSFQNKNVFGDGKGNGIAVVLDSSAQKCVGRITITDDLKAYEYLMKSDDLVITAPVSFFGKSASLDNAREVFALVFDIDYVGESELRNLIFEIENEVLPRPTYIVNSGTGIHLYYLFGTPVPLNKTSENKTKLRILKHTLTELIWNKYTSSVVEVDGKDVRQYQGITHGYRIVGGPSKLGSFCPVEAYQVGEKIDCNDLVCFVEGKCNEKIFEAITIGTKKTTPLVQASEMWPEWYKRVILGEKDNQLHPGRWTVKRELYEWWIRQIRSGAVVGHRYFCIFCLAVYAVKCGIAYDELEKDALSLIPLFDALSESDRFTESDVRAALMAYDERYVRFPRDTMSKLSAIPMTANKRNFLPQDLHLKLARERKSTLKDAGLLKKDGRPVGSGTAQATVEQWQVEHPEGRKIDCVRDTGLSKPTVYRWWK